MMHNVRRAIPTLALVGLACSSDPGGIAGPNAGTRAGTFPSGSVALSYAIDRPPGPGSFPAVVLVHGSGRSPKSDLVGLSQQFVQRGFVVLRYDKRGVGESGGTYSGVGVLNSSRVLPELAGDVVAGVQFLGTQPDVDPRRIGLVGGSQAGWIIPIAATSTPNVQFAVVLSGPTTSVGLEIYYSDLAEQTQTSLDQVRAQLPSFQGNPGFDPLPYLRRVTVPMLWLYGFDDRSIPSQMCIAIHDALKREVDVRFTVQLYEGAGHGLTPAIWPDVFAWLGRI